MTHKQAQKRGTKYEFNLMPVGEQKIIPNARRSTVLAALREWNFKQEDRSTWIGIEAVQDGNNIKVKRIF